MKTKLYIIILTVLTHIIYAQVAINKGSLNGSSTILDFEDSANNTRGIIIPSVDNISNALAPTNTENNGTFLFDKSDSKVKMYENNLWVDFSDAGNSFEVLSNNTAEYTTTQAVIIGAPSSNAKGVLVLESPNKAMILPKIENPHLTVKSPYPGTMCYDTSSRTLAIYNGTSWSYWK